MNFGITVRVRGFVTIGLLSLFFVLIVACGGSGSSQENGVSGDIEIDGSSTVFPVSVAVGEEFRRTNPGIQVNVGVSGTGGGFKRFTVGETDISNASRPISDSEAADAAVNGISYRELSVALDGLSVVVNIGNDFVGCLTTGELRKIWEVGSSVTYWSDVRSEFPRERLDLYGPDTDSGTYDYFKEVIIGDELDVRQDYQPSSDDNVLVRGVEGSINSLSFFGYAYYIENTDKLKVIGIDAGSGCVKPTQQTINDGSYSPLSRRLYIYVNEASLKQPHMSAFVRFYLEQVADLAPRVGYVALPMSEYAQALASINTN